MVWMPFNFKSRYPVKAWMANRNGVATGTHVRIVLERISHGIDILCTSNGSFFLPELPLLTFRIVPAFKYFSTFLKILLREGWLRPGNLCWKAFRTAGGLWVSVQLITTKTRSFWSAEPFSPELVRGLICNFIIFARLFFYYSRSYFKFPRALIRYLCAVA